MSSTLFCPSCGDEYVVGSKFCSDCRVALVPDPPAGGAESGADGLVRDGPDLGDMSDPAGSGGTGVTPGAGRGTTLPEGFEEIGSWPPLAAVMLVRRLIDAGVQVSALWSDPGGQDLAVLAVPGAQMDFADAVIRELPVEDELPQGDVYSYVQRIEARLAEIALLLDEMRLTEELGGDR